MQLVIFLNELIENGVNQKATDIHFKVENNFIAIYFRKQQQLVFVTKITNEKYHHIINYLKFKSNLDISIKSIPQDAAYEWKIGQKIINLRISFVPLLQNESLVIRIINQQLVVLAKEMFFNVDEYNKIFEIIRNQVGLLVFTGPTGCGKTTTMYKVLRDLVELEHKKVITIENPIEIQNKNFVQLQIDEKRNFDYSKALKSVLRQDPDIIMIGEIRDLQTAKVVMQASLTGHRIITTMHTKDKYGVYERFLDFGFKASEITSVLIGVCNQRLLKKNGKQKVFIDSANQKELLDLINGESEVNLKVKINDFFQEK